MSLLVDWNPADFDALESKILLARHRLADSGLFSEEGLAEILDRHPDSALTLATMGDDCETFEWSDGQRLPSLHTSSTNFRRRKEPAESC